MWGMFEGESSLAVASFLVALVGSMATVTALVVAIVVGVHQARRFREEAADREAVRVREREQDRRGQAEQVSALFGVEERLRQWGDSGPSYFVTAEVYNASNMPIYDVRVGLQSRDGECRLFRLPVVPGGGHEHLHLPSSSTDEMRGQPVEICFRDAADQWWSRCVEGHLHELPGPMWDEDGRRILEFIAVHNKSARSASGTQGRWSGLRDRLRARMRT